MKTEKKRKSQTSFQFCLCWKSMQSDLCYYYLKGILSLFMIVSIWFYWFSSTPSIFILSVIKCNWNSTSSVSSPSQLSDDVHAMYMRFLINWNLTRKQRESGLKLGLSSLDFLSHTRRNDRACVCIPAKRKWNWSRAEPISVSRRLREPLRATHSRTKRNTGPLNPSCGTFYHSLSLPVSLSSYWSVSVGPRMEELAAAWSSPIFRREEANWSLLRVSRCPASCSGEDV